MSFHDCKLIKTGASYREYHSQSALRGDADFSMSRSELTSFCACPRRWLDGFKSDDESTPSLEWGSLIDALLTSPASFDERFTVAPETYPDGKTGEPKPFNMNSNWCKKWKADQGDKVIVKANTKLNADAAVLAIAKNPEARYLFKHSAKQVMVMGWWGDKETGLDIPLRILIDLVPPPDHLTFGKWLCDFKTARNGNPAQWARVIDDQGYDVQAALYMDLYTAATHEDRTDFVHIVQENVAPFHVTTPFPAMSSEFLAWGRLKYEAALKLYARCLAFQEWPSYPPAGLVYGCTQLLDPGEVWNYRKTAGQAGLQQRLEYSPEPTKTYADTTGDVIP